MRLGWVSGQVGDRGARGAPRITTLVRGSDVKGRDGRGGERRRQVRRLLRCRRRHRMGRASSPRMGSVTSNCDVF